MKNRSLVTYLLPLIALLVLLIRMFSASHAQDGIFANPKSSLSHPQPSAGPLMVGPVPGLTTSWHDAPAAIAVPTGTDVLLRQEFSGGRVSWEGAEEIASEARTSVAQCSMDRQGPYVVRSTVQLQDGRSVSRALKIEAIDVDPGDLSVERPTLSVAPVNLDEESTNEETMAYYFGNESIADLIRETDGSYTTSVNRTVSFQASLSEPAFNPLLEWRFSDGTSAVGAAIDWKPRHADTFKVRVGPDTESAPRLAMNIYAVIITHPEPAEPVPEGEVVSFMARTVPAGYEPYIRWLSSTKYGTATPTLGSGAKFDVVFDQTFGDEGRWTGVRAGNSQRGDDEKCQVVSRATIPLGFSESQTMFLFDLEKLDRDATPPAPIPVDVDQILETAELDSNWIVDFRSEHFVRPTVNDDLLDGRHPVTRSFVDRAGNTVVGRFFHTAHKRVSSATVEETHALRIRSTELGSLGRELHFLTDGVTQLSWHNPDVGRGIAFIDMLHEESLEAHSPSRWLNIPRHLGRQKLSSIQLVETDVFVEGVRCNRFAISLGQGDTIHLYAPYGYQGQIRLAEWESDGAITFRIRNWEFAKLRDAWVPTRTSVELPGRVIEEIRVIDAAVCDPRLDAALLPPLRAADLLSDRISGELYEFVEYTDPNAPNNALYLTGPLVGQLQVGGQPTLRAATCGAAH